MSQDGAEHGSEKKPSRFAVDTSKAGPGKIQVSCKDPDGQDHPVDVRAVGNGLYNVQFSPKKPGDYITTFKLNGEDLPGSPRVTTVKATGKCVLIPKG